MGKNVFSINLEYKNANSQADKLDRIASQIDSQRTKIADNKQQLSGYWKGENASSYQNKMIDRENELNQIATDLRKIAAAVRTVASNTYKADMQAVQLAQQNANHGGGGRSW